MLSPDKLLSSYTLEIKHLPVKFCPKLFFVMRGCQWPLEQPIGWLCCLLHYHLSQKLEIILDRKRATTVRGIAIGQNHSNLPSTKRAKIGGKRGNNQDRQRKIRKKPQIGRAFILWMGRAGSHIETRVPRPHIPPCVMACSYGAPIEIFRGFCRPRKSKYTQTKMHSTSSRTVQHIMHT